MKEVTLSANRFEKLYRFDEVTSTMDVCEELIRSGVRRGVVVASSQTAGRGRNAKKWSSKANGNLYLSFFDELNADHIPQRCAVAAYSAVSRFVKGAETVRIKWPNDIFIGMKKVSGMIAKTMLFEGSKFYICGIGINVFMPQEEGMDFVWQPTALTEFAKVTTEEVTNALIEGCDLAFSVEDAEIIDIYGQNINWMTGKKLVFTQDLIKRENGEIVGFSEDFSVIKILTDEGLKELSALSILSLT